jgi:polyferredoxin
MPLPRLGGVTAICGGGLTIASTYLVAWGFWVDPLEVPTRGSDTLAQLSEHMGGWFGMATAVMTTGGALLVAAGLLSILLPGSRLICGISLSLGSLTVLVATNESLGLPTELSRGSAITLCLLGATLGGLGAAAALIPRLVGSHPGSSEMPVGISTHAAD